MGSPARAVAAILGFIVLGLSPSFVDWQDNPARRPEIVLYYAVAILLIYVGIIE